MRTPGQRQQNFALEALINEAAAAAKADPVQFRIDHTTDQRLIDILNARPRQQDGRRGLRHIAARERRGVRR